MISVRRQGRPTHRARASEAPIDQSSVRSNKDHKVHLGSNKSRPLKPLFEPPEASSWHSSTLFPYDPNTNCFNSWNLNRIIQTFLQASSKDRSVSENSSRPKPQTSTLVNPIWNIPTYASNLKIILPLVEPLDQTEFYLQPLSFGIGLISVGNNTSGS